MRTGVAGATSGGTVGEIPQDHCQEIGGDVINNPVLVIVRRRATSGLVRTTDSTVITVIQARKLVFASNDVGVMTRVGDAPTAVPGAYNE